MTERDPDDLLLFTPVPLARAHARGWSSDVQIAFISALSRCGVVAAAARSVGRSPRSAYQLRARPGAESFAAAWDWAIELGLRDMREAAVARALAPPERLPVLYRGKVVAYRERHDDRLILAALRAHYAEEGGHRPPHRERIRHREQMAEAEARLGGRLAQPAEPLPPAEPQSPTVPPVPPAPATPPRAQPNRPRIRGL